MVLLHSGYTLRALYHQPPPPTIKKSIISSIFTVHNNIIHALLESHGKTIQAQQVQAGQQATTQ
jgi:hypothetical protein